MNKIWTLFLVLIVGLVAVAALLPVASSGQRNKLKKAQRSIPDRYIVVLNEETLGENAVAPVVEAEADYLTYVYGGKRDHLYSSAIKGFSAEMSPEQAKALSNDDRVKFVEEDAEISASAAQNPAEWHLDRADQRTLPLNGSYNYSTTGAGVHVYVVDSGIRISHQDFGGRASVSFDGVNDGQNGLDCFGHGTHVAGIIGSSTYGVAKDVSLHSVRVLPCSGSGQVSTLMAGVDWITANKIKPAVANISITLSGISTAMEAAINTSINSGVTYTIAAGNYGSDACNFSPGHLSSALTVGATTIYDERTAYSNYGPCVDIFAPGNVILSLGHTSDTATRTMSGTSMAAPMVAGAAALYLQANPNASPASVGQAITGASTSGVVSNIDGSSPDKMLYSQIAGGPPPPPPPTPTPAPTATPTPAPKPASITVKKSVNRRNGNSAASTTAFPYAATKLASSNFALTDNQSYVDAGVISYGAANMIDVTEDQVAGFKLVSVSCVETSSGPPSIKNTTVDLINRKARIIAEEGESIVCTFTSDEMSVTSGEAAITGRVVNANGMGIRGVRLTLFNASTGESHSSITNSFGFYSFDGLDVQNFYILTAMETKLYRIPNPTRSFTLSDNLAGLDFMVGPPGRW